jgi:hypothetical protein
MMKKTILLVLISFLLAKVAMADFTFGEPTNLGSTVNSEYADWLPCISADGLELYIDSLRPGGYGGEDLWVATRETIDDDWITPVNLGGVVNSPKGDATARVSADGLELYFESNRSGGSGSWDIWVTRRTTRDADWGTPVNLGPTVNSPSIDTAPSISSDGLELYFASNRSGGYGSGDLYVSTRAARDSDWGTPMNLGPTINGSYADYWPFITSDGLALFFSSDSFGPFRPGGSGSSDIWMTMRKSITDPWQTPVNLGPIINSPSEEGGPVVSLDGTTLYWDSKRSGGLGSGDIWQASIIPIVDFNADGIVNSADMCIMVDYWGTDNSLCDIGPMPWGDGIVDVEDLKVLAEHLFEEIPPAQ